MRACWDRAVYTLHIITSHAALGTEAILPFILAHMFSQCTWLQTIIKEENWSFIHAGMYSFICHLFFLHLWDSFFSSTTCNWCLNNLRVCGCPYLCICDISARAGKGIVLQILHVCVFVCVTARGGGGRLEVRCNRLFKPQGSTSTTTTPLQSFCPTPASSPGSAKLRDQWARNRHTSMNTHTHLLEQQLYTASQSNTSLQHQNTSTTCWK